jgi:hypothetical protein
MLSLYTSNPLYISVLIPPAPSPPTHTLPPTFPHNHHLPFRRSFPPLFFLSHGSNLPKLTHTLRTIDADYLIKLTHTPTTVDAYVYLLIKLTHTPRTVVVYVYLLIKLTHTPTTVDVYLLIKLTSEGFFTMSLCIKAFAEHKKYICCYAWVMRDIGVIMGVTYRYLSLLDYSFE